MSPRWSISKEELKKVLWVLVWVAASAVVTKLIEIIPGLDLSPNIQMAVMGLLNVFGVLAKKIVSDTR